MWAAGGMENEAAVLAPDEAFGQTFAELQRRFAEPGPDRPVRKSDVVADIADVRTAIDRFPATPANVRRDFVVLRRADV